MAVVFFVLAGLVAVHSAINYQFLYNERHLFLPPQFQEDLTSRYAFPVYALDPSTPLGVQARYLRILWSGCFCFFCVSLGFFLAENFVFGAFSLMAFCYSVFWAVKSWNTYRQNCDRPLPPTNEE